MHASSYLKESHYEVIEEDSRSLDEEPLIGIWRDVWWTSSQEFRYHKGHAAL